MVRAVFLDFYGTVVHEDGAVVHAISQRIAAASGAGNPQSIEAYWWETFQALCKKSFGAQFQTQRVLEQLSLEQTLRHFGSAANAGELSELMFAHWVKPPIFKDAKRFLKACPVPVCIVSNIDRADLLEAIRYHHLTPAGVYTSEDARAYKPGKELFEQALARTGLQAHEAVHIGDSLNSDVRGASALGIHTIRVNRARREIPQGVTAVGSLTHVFDTPVFQQ